MNVFVFTNGDMSPNQQHASLISSEHSLKGHKDTCIDSWITLSVMISTVFSWDEITETLFSFHRQPPAQRQTARCSLIGQLAHQPCGPSRPGPVRVPGSQSCWHCPSSCSSQHPANRWDPVYLLTSIISGDQHVQNNGTLINFLFFHSSLFSLI